jgi:hypothetical protein
MGSLGTVTVSPPKDNGAGSMASTTNAPSGPTVTASRTERIESRERHASYTSQETTCTKSVYCFVTQYSDWTSCPVMIWPFSAKSTSSCSQPGQRTRANSRAMAF